MKPKPTPEDIATLETCSASMKAFVDWMKSSDAYMEMIDRGGDVAGIIAMARGGKDAMLEDPLITAALEGMAELRVKNRTLFFAVMSSIWMGEMQLLLNDLSGEKTGEKKTGEKRWK
jgi:hypothetical protein